MRSSGNDQWVTTIVLTSDVHPHDVKDSVVRTLGKLTSEAQARGEVKVERFSVRKERCGVMCDHGPDSIGCVRHGRIW